MSKSAHVVLKDGGDSIFYDVTDLVVHGSGALLVVISGDEGAAFAPGTWERGDLINEEQTEGDSQES